MNIHKMTRMLFPAATLIVVLSLAAPARAQIAPDDGDRVRFGMIGIARTQTARLNIVAITPDSPDLPPGPCRVQLQFRDALGALIKASEASLQPGQSAFLDLPHDDPFFRSGDPRAQAPDDGDRHQIRATWIAPDAPDMPQCARAKFIATVEVFVADGRTTVLYPGKPAGVDDPNL